MPKQFLQEMEMKIRSGDQAAGPAGGSSKKVQLQREKEELKRKIASKQKQD